MPDQVRVLLVEDSENDALLVTRTLSRGGFEPIVERVEYEVALRKALAEREWDVVLCDYNLPAFNGPAALALVRQIRPGVPVIVVSGAIGEETAVEMMRAGASDYVMKGRLERLCPAIRRELQQAEARREQVRTAVALQKAERELTSWNKLHEIFFRCAGDDIFEAVLALVLESLASPNGMFGYINEDGAFVCAAMVGDAWPEELVPGQNIAFPSESWGRLWRIALTEKKTFCSNEPPRMPPGHVALANVLVTPIGHRDDVIGLFAVGNKSGGYSADDCAHLESIAAEIAPTLQARLERSVEERARTRAAERQRLAVEVLETLNVGARTGDAIAGLVRMIKEFTGFHAVGIRLRNGEDFPYYETRGFFDDFLRLETSLCQTGPDGRFVRDEAGGVVLECLCGAVIQGRADPALPFFTPQGSFWTNSIGALLAETDAAALPARIRGRCATMGFESVALIPLRSGEEIIGLLQLNDRRQGRLTRETIEFFEGIATSVGIALHRSQAEKMVREKEARFRELFENMSNGVVIYEAVDDGADFVIRDINHGAERMEKTTYEDVAGRRLRDAFPGAVAFGLAEVLRRVWRTGTAEKLPRALYRDERASGWRESHVLRLPTGEVVAIFDDVTAQVEAEEALRKNEEKYRLIAENVTDIIWTTDLTFRFNYISPSVERVRGLPVGEAMAQRPEDIMPPSSLESALQVMAEEMAAENDPQADPARVRTVEWEEYCKDGSIIWTENQMTFLRDDRGRPTGIIGVTRDITERKQSELALRHAAAKIQDLYDNAPCGYHSVAANGVVMQINETELGWLGYTRDEVVGKMTLADLLAPAQRPIFAENFPHFREQGSLRNFETEMIRRDGATLPVTINATAVKNANGQFIMSRTTVSDITDRKAAEEDRRRLEGQLRQQQKLESLGTLASGVAHEINNPLTGILNFAELIQTRSPADDKTYDYAGKIVAESKRVATIVRNLLAFARQEKEHHSPTDMRAVVADSVALVDAVLRKDQIALTVEVADRLPMLRCRSQQIQQVIVNLITNARDALNERYPGYDADKTMAVRVMRIERDGESWVRTVVEDHGVGMNEATLNRVFDPFFTTKPRGIGTGLGLSVSHGIVREHRGELLVESEEMKFTRFCMDLPAGDAWSPASADGREPENNE
jgi:PAS domain S-box-containing protein